MHTNGARAGECAHGVAGGVGDHDLHRLAGLRFRNAIRDFRAVRRRVGNKSLVAVSAARTAGGVRRLPQFIRCTRRKKMCLFRDHGGGQLLQRRNVHDINRATVRTGDQLMITGVNLQIVYRHGGQP